MSFAVNFTQLILIPWWFIHTDKVQHQHQTFPLSMQISVKVNFTIIPRKSLTSRYRTRTLSCTLTRQWKASPNIYHISKNSFVQCRNILLNKTSGCLGNVSGILFATCVHVAFYQRSEINSIQKVTKYTVLHMKQTEWVKTSNPSVTLLLLLLYLWSQSVCSRYFTQDCYFD